MPQHKRASRASTIEAILTESQRPGRVPIRKTFVQQGRGRTTRPGPLAQFVQRGRLGALTQYLLLIAWASAKPFDVRRDARVWARAGGLQGAAGRTAVSRNWAFLRELNLVSIQRTGKLAKVTLLREDGSGREYTKPATKGDQYLKLPYAYWRDGYHTKLKLPGTAMLLIALSRPDAFVLPADRAMEWYGISRSTAERGLRELRHAGVLNVVRDEKEAPLAPEGYTFVNFHTLLPPFRPKGDRGGR